MLNIEDFADRNELFDGHYALIRPLSVDGATADVWLALDVNTVSVSVDVSEVARLSEEELNKLGLIVAIKIYRPQNALDIEGEQRFREEYMIVYNCHHANLIHPTHFSIFKETPYLVLPYCKLGSSELLIGNLTDEEKIWKYILDVSSGLAYLHAMDPPIIHQDIKPANILLDDTLNYAITDFGISSKKGGFPGHENGFEYDEENSGTMAYMAPERFLPETEPIPQSDIWAFGATLYELLTGRVPFGEEGGQTQINDNNVSIPEIAGCSPDIQRLIHACLAKEPGDRPSAVQLMESARAKQFPIKHRPMKLIYSLLIILGGIMIAALSYYFAKPEESLVIKKEVPLDVRYNNALQNLNSSDNNTLKLGISQMDSLCGLNYIPALYQMGFTYGWYSDSLSVKRKNILGIEVDKDKMPVNDSYNSMAISYFTRIMELNDSTYASINAQALYRIASYYINKNGIYQQNVEKGKEFLEKSKEWAMIARDKDLVYNINKYLNGSD